MIQAGIYQPKREFEFPKPSIKAVAELVQVFLEICMGNPMVGPIQKLFQITDDNVNQWQPGRSLFGRRHLFFMVVRLIDDVHRMQRVCSNVLSFFDMTIKKAFDVFAGNGFHDFHGHKSGLVPFVFNGHDNRRFPFGSSSSFAGLFPANIGVINFNKVIEKLIHTVPTSHRRPDLFQNVSGSWP